MIASEKVLVMDVDGTLCPSKQSHESYAELLPDPAMLERLRWYREQGYYVILATARNMRTHQGNVGKLNADTLPTLIDWLRLHDVPHDEVHVGKPWAGSDGFYVDDRAVRPSEFLSLSPEEIDALVERNRVCER